MELNRKYDIKLIGRATDGRSTFVAVERQTLKSSKYFWKYFDLLSKFNECGEWFNTLGYPDNGLGEIVNVQIRPNYWARGIVVNPMSRLVYLIDHQKLYDGHFIMRWCPEKFKQLKLPTFYIHVNFSLNDCVPNFIETLIERQRRGEIQFCFTPEYVYNLVYVGELLVVDKSSSISLKELHTKYNNGELQTLKNTLFYNPVNEPCLKQIFKPEDSSILDQNKPSISDMKLLKTCYKIKRSSA